MAEEEATNVIPLPPKKLEELPLHVRQFLATLTVGDVKAFASTVAVFKWLATGGKVLKWVLMTGLSAFGTMVVAGQGWEWIATKFFTHVVP